MNTIKIAWRSLHQWFIKDIPKDGRPETRIGSIGDFVVIIEFAVIWYPMLWLGSLLSSLREKLLLLISVFINTRVVTFYLGIMVVGLILVFIDRTYRRYPGKVLLGVLLGMALSIGFMTYTVPRGWEIEDVKPNVTFNTFEDLSFGQGWTATGQPLAHMTTYQQALKRLGQPNTRKLKAKDHTIEVSWIRSRFSSSIIAATFSRPTKTQEHHKNDWLLTQKSFDIGSSDRNKLGDFAAFQHDYPELKTVVDNWRIDQAVSDGFNRTANGDAKGWTKAYAQELQGALVKHMNLGSMDKVSDYSLAQVLAEVGQPTSTKRESDPPYEYEDLVWKNRYGNDVAMMTFSLANDGQYYAFAVEPLGFTSQGGVDFDQ